MENLPQEQRKQRLIQPKPSEKGEIITYLSRMGDVLEQITERGKIIVPFVAVHAVIDGDIPNIPLSKETLGIVAHFQIVPAHAGHILDNDGSNLSCFGQPDHFIPARTVKCYPRHTIVNEELWIRETVVGCVLQKDFLLKRDLSRVFSPLIMICR